MNQHMEKLRQVLAQEDSVLFIGSGISMWSGLPSWSQLIEELARFIEESGANADLVREEALRGDLLQAASFGFDKLTKQQIGDFVRGACRYGVAKPHEIHRKIVSLGPRCFITTNYDNLIEEGLRLWQPDRFYRPPVTNRQLTETAEIVHARAIDFVFKPHGDAADSDSIILTREQYRQLLPDGERHAALESLKMLLASRPVVYLGFGLRDPDFVYLRDLLANTYKGGTRDHYAITADVSEPETDYWRRNYGIHLVGYTTIECLDKSRDHGPLLNLLDELLQPAATTPSASLDTDFSPETVLALARHAARLTRTSKSEPEFPIRVHLEESGQRIYYTPARFDHWPVERFLDAGPKRALLIGLPGAGKTYSLRQAAARLGEKLNEVCLDDPFEAGDAVVPILADLKLYRGSLHELLERTLPSSLPLDFLAQNFRLKIFLDSFNEMPREFWESGSYEADFAQFIDQIGNASLLISSRTSDGLSKTGFPSYNLDQIDEAFIDSELGRLGIDVSGRFEREIRWLLQKPFYFQLVATRSVNLPTHAHPRDFYQTFFTQLTHSFERRFGQSLNLEGALSLAAYEAIDRGEEAQPLMDLLRLLDIELQAAGIKEITAQDIANWLVSKSVIIPYTGARVAFFHQSATEYLAASSLARRYQITPSIVKDKLSLTRWDQALFLALSLLPRDAAAAFVQSVIEADFSLALNATKYLEFDRDELVAKLLDEIPHRREDFDPYGKGQSALEFGVPLSETHEPNLRAIMKCGGSIGAVAVKRLVQLRGESVKDELLKSLIEYRDDYNYCCNGVASALRPFIAMSDVDILVALVDSIEGEVTPDADDEVAHGLISGIAALLAGIEIPIIRDAMLPRSTSSRLSEVRARVLCHSLWSQHSTAALDLALDLLLRGVNEAATAIYFITHFSEPEDGVSWSSLTNDHVERLLLIIEDENADSWALESLKCVCQGRPDMAAFVKARAMNSSDLVKAALLYCVSTEDNEPVFQALTEFIAMSDEQRGKEPTHLLRQIELNWGGHETLLVELLKLRNAKLAMALVDNIHDYGKLGALEIGPIEWWLEWLLDEEDSDLWWWLRDRLARLFAENLRDEDRYAFVAEFNKPTSRFRRLLAHSVLPARSDLTTDSFSEDAISFLLADLNRGATQDFMGGLLGTTATEAFVSERLLPLLPEAKEPLLKNLKNVLRQAGSRHGRRYVSE